MDLRQIFALNLQRHRRSKGWSQEELAHKADINRTYISKLETGKTWAGLEVISKLAKVLGIEPHALLTPAARTRTRQG